MRSMCAHHVLLVTKTLCNFYVIKNGEHLPVAVDYSVADRFLPELCGGSNYLKGETAINCRTKQTKV